MCDIHARQIWEVMTDKFLTTADCELQRAKRPVKIGRGEKIEIRYPYAWHFRTGDNLYFHATPEMIAENCKLIGTVRPEIAFENKANLEEILRLRLFDKIPEPPTKQEV